MSCHLNKRRFRLHLYAHECERLKVPQIDEWVEVFAFLLKLSELGSDRSQDDAVCRRRLFIFLNQGNISKELPVSF